MKVGAHPLVVAVALGFLGPGVLSEVEDDGCGGEGCPCGPERAASGDCASVPAPAEDPLDVAEDPLDVAEARHAWGEPTR